MKYTANLQELWDAGMEETIPAGNGTAMAQEQQTEVEAGELSDGNTQYSIREEDPPKKTGIAYKVFFEKNGKLYPPMVANPGGADTPVGVWLNADVGAAAPPSKTGRLQVKAGGKGTQGGSGSLAFRPGWHLGDIPKASQFNRLNKATGVKELFPYNFVWAECEYAMDVDYQEEAMSYGYNASGKFQHSLAGLPRLPVDGYYHYRTNPDPSTVPWVITGAMKVNKILSRAEVDEILRENGVEPTKWQGPDGEQMEADDMVKQYSMRGKYDYSKSFEKQVDDWKNGNFPTGDSLLVGRTPELYRQIGMGDLPMTINQTHVDYIVNGTKDADHFMGEAWLKKLPEMLKRPVAVIRSDTDAENSVVVILAEKINGKQIIAPVYVNGVSTNNSLRIDSNTVATVFGKGNALTKMLTDALIDEASAGNTIGVYYWNKKEAQNLYRSAGLQLPGSSVQDGLIHSIFDAGSEVNRRMIENQTNTQQFKRWFGNSKVVDEEGNPLIVYHGTDAAFNAFDMTKGRANMDIQGAFFSPYIEDAQGYGGTVKAVYLKIENPADESTAYRALNRFKGQNGAGSKAREYLIKMGYDGVYNGYDEYIAFYPTQIKSATDNVGTFDQETADIRYSTRDKTDAVSVREYLAGMTPKSYMNDTEVELLKRYQTKLKALQEKQRAGLMRLFRHFVHASPAVLPHATPPRWVIGFSLDPIVHGKNHNVMPCIFAARPCERTKKREMLAAWRMIA